MKIKASRVSVSRAAQRGTKVLEIVHRHEEDVPFGGGGTVHRVERV